ncbi:MAG: DUF2274 domain-containing protein [Caulobacter sp.]
MKLPKLPDRNPVRITFTALPELNAALQDYASAYLATYGETATVSDLVPFILEAYLAGDREFAKARKALPGAIGGHPQAPSTNGKSKEARG